MAKKDSSYDNFLAKTVWLWLPFFVLYRATMDIVALVEKRYDDAHHS